MVPLLVLRRALLLVAAAITLLAIALPWWTVVVEGQGVSTKESARPFDHGEFGDLDDDVVVTGVLLAGAVLALAAAAALDFVKPDYRWRHLVLGAAVALGAAAVLHAAFGWPEAARSEPHLAFWDETTYGAPIPGFGGITVAIRAYAGAGWYVALASGVLIPAVAWSLTGRRPAPAARPTALPVYTPTAPTFESFQRRP